jgi:hypothetical protein
MRHFIVLFSLVVRPVLLDWQTNTETRLPNFPNGQRVVYPLNAAAVLLPLTPENNYTPEVVICGGSQISCVSNIRARLDLEYLFLGTKPNPKILTHSMTTLQRSAPEWS